VAQVQSLVQKLKSCKLHGTAKRGKKKKKKTFPNLIKDINIQEAQQTPGKMNSKRLTLRHIIIKFPKDKES